MNKPMQHRAGYWGTKTDFASLLEHVRKIGPVLEANAEANDELGRLNEATFEALKPLRMSHIFATEEIGGAQLSPTKGLELIEAITYHSGSAGWVSMVHACIGAMSAAFLPDSAIERLYAPGTENRFSGQGTPTGMLKKVDGGYLLNGKWSYASGIYHATHTHTAALVDDGTGQPAKDANGDVIVLCAHAAVGKHELLGNWDVLGPAGDRQHRLRRQGRVHPRRHGVPDPDGRAAAPEGVLQPRRRRPCGHRPFRLGDRRLAPHAGRDRQASRAPRPAAPGCSAKATSSGSTTAAPRRGYVRRAPSCSRSGATSKRRIEAGNRVPTRQISLIHLAKSEVHEAGVDACQFAYRAAGGASLRNGVMQRVYREMLTAANHFTINANIVGAAGREIGGVWSQRVWQFYDLIEKK